jgi:colanic acid biosynthesis glycosyl transferase WcaI
VTLKDLPLFRLTLPSKVQAALAMGRPIVGAVAGDAAELLLSSRAALVVPPSDGEALAKALLEIASASPAERSHMGSRARAFYEARLSQATGSRAIESLLECAAS